MRRLCLIVALATALLAGCRKERPGEVVPAREPGLHPTAAWILACRVEGEGFGCFPGDSAFVSRTGMAVEALAGLGELGRLQEAGSLVFWLKGRQQPDGGFLEARDFYNGKPLPWGSMSALEPTYWAVKTLKRLGSGPDRPGEAVRFIYARQRDSGAFDACEVGWGGTREAVYSTFWAVAALRELGAPVPDSARVVGWLRNMQDTRSRRGGFRLSVDNWNFSSVPGTFYAVSALHLLGARPGRPAEVKKYLLSSYGQEADGGFEVGLGDDWNNFDHYSLMQDTYGAVRALDLLGMPLADGDTSRAARPASDCADWICSVQNPDGGFARVGVTDQTPLASPSEMRATWQAVQALKLLGCQVPRPQDAVEPVNEVRPHLPAYRHPTIHNDDPAEVWAYRRIAWPIYSHFLEKTGSRIEALGWLSRWARAVVGPENASYLTGGRGLLMGGWGQCGQMSLMLQQLASSVDHAARYSFVIGDVNCEILLREKGWEQPHWCLFIPFTNEYPDPGVPSPDGKLNGWSLLDCVIDYNAREKNLNYPSRTELGDHLFASVRVETIDYDRGTWGVEYKMDSLTTYGSEAAVSLYPGAGW
ncbi:MAG: terpene cyclase/mutase family protein [Candidatus Glassbacteria bacterium]|nr:terpene cyclase/mutase family protein [Candidatus Glassbacteria bacterium]